MNTRFGRGLARNFRDPIHHGMSFSSSRAAPRTLTESEQGRLLKVTVEHVDGFRDHIILGIALGCGLREHEILALDVGDISRDGRTVRSRFPLRVFKGGPKEVPAAAEAVTTAAPQEVFVPDALGRKLMKFLRWKAERGESLEASVPLFVTRLGTRLGARALRYAFAAWQVRAGFDRHFRFHDLRHTALTNLYRRTRDIRLVQRVARHANVQTTTIYALPSDEDVAAAVRALTC